MLSMPFLSLPLSLSHRMELYTNGKIRLNRLRSNSEFLYHNEMNHEQQAMREAEWCSP